MKAILPRDFGRAARTLALSGLLALAACLVPSPLAAQGAHTGGAHTGGAAMPVAPRDRFSEQYTEASRAWHEGRYDEALERFRELYRTSGRHELLYDIGLTADRLGRLQEAIEAFESYLANVPGARNRADVERRLASLREDLRQQQAATQPTPPPLRTAPPREELPVMTLMGEQPALVARDTSRSVVVPTTPEARPYPQPIADPVADPIADQGGPVFVWTWPFLLLTAGAAIAAPVVWVEGEARRDGLLEQCAASACSRDYVTGRLEGYELATNALWISAVGLGVITAIVFLVEGSGRTTVVRRDVAGARLQLGAGTLGIEGAF